ncbi:Chaperone of endosialidase [Spirosomataceae bacterium TFI 002]|nr:Chaperone of endosialidase [Spirosomataceae bacterium TFI 002]
MKKLYIFLISLISISAAAQISSNGTTDGSITITPKGLHGSSNTTAEGGNLALGSNALQKTIYDGTVSTYFGAYNTAIGDSSLYSNVSGYFNTGLGAFSLQINSTGKGNAGIGYGALNRNENGDFNTAIGNITLFSNTSGIRNTAVGNAALVNNTTASYNTAVGNYALFYNKTASSNTAIGNQTLFLNTEGVQNTAVGSFALLSNKTAQGNTAIGASALSKSISDGNTAIGWLALNTDSLGAFNTAVGSFTGENLTFGDLNSFLGYNAGTTKDSLSNSTAVGANAKVNASNKVRIGDANISVIEGQVAWSNPSDRRLKESIVYTSRLGLDFVNGLKTVSYNYIADKNKVRYDGFIAQDVEKLMEDLNIPFSGLKKSDNGMFSLAYSDFVMPLVNAIQEQQKEIEALKAEALENRDLRVRLEQLEAKMTNR